MRKGFVLWLMQKATKFVPKHRNCVNTKSGNCTSLRSPKDLEDNIFLLKHFETSKATFIHEDLCSRAKSVTYSNMNQTEMTQGLLNREIRGWPTVFSWLVKFIYYSEKATKIWRNFIWNYLVASKIVSSYFCSLLRIYELEL